MAWQIVYDVRSAGLKSLLWPLATLAMTTVTVVDAYVPQILEWFLGHGWLLRRARKSLHQAVALFFIGLPIYYVGQAIDHIHAMNQLTSGNFQVVEGKVANLRYYPDQMTDKVESFEVNSVPFRIGEAETAAFDTRRSEGSPIAEGLPVRITYHGNDILRLEIAQP
jgi:hypothetical protein